MNAVLEHVENDLREVRKARKEQNLYEHGFSCSFIDPRHDEYLIEFNDLSNNKHPAFIISISNDQESLELCLLKGSDQRDNVQNNRQLIKIQSFAKYSRESLSEAADTYYTDVCRIFDA